MIANHGAFGRSKPAPLAEPSVVLNQAGIEKAQRNRKIFQRALVVIQKELGMTREDALRWLDDDSDPAWGISAQEHTD